MENSIVNVKAYVVLIPVYIKSPLDIFETTVLRYLRQGKSLEFIQKKLFIPLENVFARLREKRILCDNGSFFYKNIDEWYDYSEKELVKATIFFDMEEGRFFNCWFYPQEPVIYGDSLVATYLGQSYTNEYNAIKILSSYTLKYSKNDVQTSKPENDYAKRYTHKLKKITYYAFDIADYVLINDIDDSWIFKLST